MTKSHKNHVKKREKCRLKWQKKTQQVKKRQKNVNFGDQNSQTSEK